MVHLHPYAFQWQHAEPPGSGLQEGAFSAQRAMEITHAISTEAVRRQWLGLSSPEYPCALAVALRACSFQRASRPSGQRRTCNVASALLFPASVLSVPCVVVRQSTGVCSQEEMWISQLHVYRVSNTKDLMELLTELEYAIIQSNVRLPLLGEGRGRQRRG